VSFRVKFYNEDKLVRSTILKEKVDKSSYSYNETNLMSGVYYKIDNIRMNDQGKGGIS